MDADNVDVMLFGHRDIENDVYDPLSDMSDDELLFAPVEDDPMLEKWVKNPNLTSESIDTQTDAEVDHTVPRRGSNKTAQVPSRDRYCSHIFAFLHQ